MKLSGYMSLSALIVIIEELCDSAKPTRAKLESDDFSRPHVQGLSALLPSLRTAHVTGSVLDEPIAALVVELGALDGRCDQIVGGLWRVATGAAMLAQEDDPTLASALEAAASVFAAGGLNRLTTARYDSIGGEAQRRFAQLTDAHKAALEEIKVGARSLLDYLDDWVALAVELSSQETKRQQLIEANKTAPRMTTGQVLALRRDAIRRVQRLIDSLEDSAISEEDKALILAPIEAASNAAAKARRK
jgi:hypothetical protein